MAVKRRTADGSGGPSANFWTVENELKLLKASLKFKPAGITKHFNMVLIYNELSRGGMRDVTPAAIWDHLGQMYNLEAANNIENNDLGLDTDFDGGEFKLPKKEFQEAMNEMKKPVVVEAAKETPSSETKEKAAPSAPPTPVETPKTTGTKRPLRSTPGSGPSAKRRK